MKDEVNQVNKMIHLIRIRMRNRNLPQHNSLFESQFKNSRPFNSMVLIPANANV